MFTSPPTLALLTRAVEALRAVAQSLLAQLVEPTAALPEAHPTATTRIARALTWLAALTETLAGGRHYHRPTRITVTGLLTTIAPHLFPQPTPPSPRRHTPKPRAESHRAAARLRYMRRVFATVPTATIATRLARRLGLTETSPEWPHALTTIAEPPAIWATHHHPQPETFPSVGVLARAAQRLTAAIAQDIAHYQLE